MNFFSSLSLETGASAVFAVTILFMFGLLYFKKTIHVLFALFVPCAAATVLYWWPVFFYNRPTGEYSAWAFLFIPLWTAAGVVPVFLFWFFKRGLFASKPWETMLKLPWNLDMGKPKDE